MHVTAQLRFSLFSLQRRRRENGGPKHICLRFVQQLCFMSKNLIRDVRLDTIKMMFIINEHGQKVYNNC